MRIVLTGFMGSGKSTVGKLLADQLGVSFSDTDDIVVLRSEFNTVQEIFKEKGEKVFRDLESRALSVALSSDNIIVAAGGGVVVKDRNCDIVSNAGGHIVYLSCPFEEIKNRIGTQGTRPLFTDVKKGLALYEERLPIYEGTADFIVNTAGKNPRDVAYDIAKLMGENGIS